LLTARNAGPDPATGVLVADALPPASTFVSATATQGSCGLESAIVTCTLGTLPVGATAAITIVLRPTAAGLLDNFALIVGALPEVELLLVGQGAHATALRRLAAASPAASRIRLLGAHAREALPPFYQAADLFLFASETETQGLVLAEAHACGLAAVAVRASGVEEVVVDGETGLLTKPDARDLADAAIGLLLDPVRRAAMGAAGRLVVERHFAAAGQVDAMVARYAALRR
jgi:1,2-diacylglycerol 3-alpha-glucosyltransferase